MPLTPSITPSPSLQQAQTANMEAQKANLTNGNTQISGGTAVGSTGTYNPGQVQTNQVPTIAPPAQVQTSGAVSATPKLPTQEATPTPVLPNTQSTTTSQPTTSATQDQNWIGNVKPATLPTTKPATPSTPATPTAPTVPQTAMPDIYGKASTEQKQSADSLLNIVDPTGNLSPAAQADIKNAFLSGDTANMQRIADVYGMDATQTANFINAYRTTRDANLSENRTTSQASLANDRAVQEYDTAIAQQQAKVKATANNMSVMQDTAGRLQSQNMADAIVGEMQMQQRILANLQQSKNWALAEIASNAKYQHDVLANNYNDAMSQYDSQLQEQIKNLSDTGLAGTAKGLSALQSNIEKTNLAKLQLGQQYASSLKSATDIMKMQVAKRTADIDITNQINDGYLHNAQGEVVVGPSGKPLVSNPQKKLSSTTTDNQGNIIGIYSDGTHAVISEGQPATVQDIHNYAKAVQAGGDSILKMLPQNIQQQVMSYMGQAGMSPTEKPITQTIENPDGTKTTVQYNKETNSWTPITIPTAGAGGDLRHMADQFPGQAWAKNNNPAGITWNANFDKGTGTAKLLTDAGVQFSKGTPRPASEGGNYVTFPTIEDGLKAQRIMMTQTYGNSTVGQMLASWVGTSEGPNYANQVAKMAGLDPTTPISSLSEDQVGMLQMAKIQKESPGLAKLLQSGAQGAQETQSSPERQFSQDQKNLMDIVGNNPTKEDLAQMQKAGLSYTDLANYVRSNKGASAPQSLYDVVLNPKATEGQRASYKYALRMADSEKPIQDMENKYKDSWAVTEMLAPSGVAPEFMKTTDRQKFEQAQRDWVNANLRKESGAVISDSEFANAAKQYFPQSGDSNEVIDQKRKDRYNATYGMLKEVGRDENGNEIAQIYAQKNQGTPSSQEGTAPSQDRVNNIKNLLMKK